MLRRRTVLEPEAAVGRAVYRFSDRDQCYS